MSLLIERELDTYVLDMFLLTFPECALGCTILLLPLQKTIYVLKNRDGHPHTLKAKDGRTLLTGADVLSDFL